MRIFRLAAVLFLTANLSCYAEEKRPNVLFIVCDDLNTHISTSGYPHIQTPAWDRLAADGMTFRRAYCQYPVCGPSRASFLSGLYPESTGVIDNKADIRKTRPDTVSLPQAFKEQGYWTAGTGKIFHNQQADHGDTAWDEREWFSNDEMPIVTKARKEFESKNGAITDRKNRKVWKEHLPTVATQTRGQHVGYGPSGLTDAQHADGKNALQASAWLENKSYGAKPFIAVGIHKPHVPFLAPDVYFDLYPKDKLQFQTPPKEIWSQLPKSAHYKRYETFGFERDVENNDLRREYMQAYHACISFIDAQIGAVLDSLKKFGHWDDTIIVLTSDHGYQLGEHFLWGKVALFEVCNRVPFIIRVPGITDPGSTSQGLVELIDCFPTLTELSGIKAPDDLQGRSLVPMLKYPQKAPGKDIVYTVVARGKNLGKAIRTQRYRYAKWPDGEELYDLDNDPMEHHNLVRSSKNGNTLTMMRQLLTKAEAAAKDAENPVK